MSGGEDVFPGASATAAQVLRLADEYRRAAIVLAPCGRAGEPLSRAPYRLLAIQAIELYLNAFLLSHGHDAVSVRRLQHDLGARARLAASAGLKLRMRTYAHLESLCTGREYLISRYAPERDAGSQLNRLAATLDEIARKTAAVATPVRAERAPAPRLENRATSPSTQLTAGLKAPTVLLGGSLQLTT